MRDDNKRSGPRALLSYKQYEVLKAINELGGHGIYITQVATRLADRITWAHTLRTLKQFDKMGLISTAKKGRVRLIEITPKGKEALKLMDRLVELMQPISKN